MIYHKLGGSNIEVSAVCMGGWSIVTDDFTWGPQDLADSMAAIRASLDEGVNFFDTAEMYGDGQSEEILARALEGRRADVVIASKVGPGHLAPGDLREHCEQSLRRLRTDYIDLYQVHWPDPKIPVHETVEAMEQLKRRGMVREIGVSNFGVSYLRELLPLGKAVSNQVCYSLLWRAIEFEVAPLCVQNGVSVLCYSPLAQGLLTGKFASAAEVPPQRARTRLFSGSRPHSRHGQSGAEMQTFDAIAKVRAICDELGQPMANVALAWLLAQKGVAAVVAGARNADQARDNVRAAALTLPEDVLGRLAEATGPVKAAMGANADPWQTQSRMEKA
jgi:aryl-alcohol dehydrogenase-like predicted oxidoreductase